MRKLIVIATLIFLAGCAERQKTGLEMYADGLDCLAAYGNRPECEAMQQRGMAQALRDAGDGYDIGRGIDVRVH